MNRDRSKGDFEKFCEPIKLGFCEALEFPSQAELINCEINRFNVSGIQRVNELMILTAVPIPAGMKF